MVEKAKAEVQKELTEKFESEKKQLEKKFKDDKAQSLMQIKVETQSREEKLSEEKTKLSKQLKI